MANKQKHLAAAQKHMAKGNHAKAVREFERAFELDPTDVRVLLKVGEAKQKAGDGAGATETYYQVAALHGQNGFLLKAAAVYKRILTLDPRNVDVHLRLAEVYHQLGLLSDAMSFYYTVAGILQEDGESNGYQEVLRRMATLEPQNVGIRIKLAEHYSRHGQVSDAVEQFRMAGQQLLETGRIDDYVKVAERLIYHDPDDLAAVRQLVRTYLTQGDTKRALAKLQIAAKADSQDTETLELLIETFQRLGEPQKANQVLREKAKLHDTRGEVQRAQQCWRQLLEINPLDAEVRARLGLDNAGENTSLQEAPELEVEPLVGAGPPPPATGYAQAPQAQVAASFVEPEAQETLQPDVARSIDAVGDNYDTQQVEIQRLLTETDVYIKYGLVDRAFEHLRNVFLMDPNNLAAMERIKEMHFQAGYYPQAVDELLRMSKLAALTDREKAIDYLREALQIMPDSEDALALAEQWELGRDELFPNMQEAAQLAAMADALPGAESVDNMLAHLTADLSDDELDELEGAEELDIEVEVDMDIMDDFDELDDADLEVYSAVVEDLDVGYEVDPDGAASQVMLIPTDPEAELPSAGSDDLAEIQAGFGLSAEEMRDLSLALSEAEDSEEIRAVNFNEGDASHMLGEIMLATDGEGEADDTGEVPMLIDDDDDDDDLILIDDDDDDDEIGILDVDDAPTGDDGAEPEIEAPVVEVEAPRRALVTPPPGVPTAPMVAKPESTIISTGLPTAPLSPPKRSLTPSPAARNELRKLADHFKHEVATTAYTPASDLGTVTEADIHGGREEEEGPTSLIDVNALRQRMLSDLAAKSTGPPKDPSVVPSDDDVEVPEDLALELEEVDFYLAQGLNEEARGSLTDLLDDYPEHPVLLSRLASLDAPAAAPDATLKIDPQIVTLATDAVGGDGAGAVVLDAYQAGINHMPALGVQDESSHLELGLAYREMGLLDDAITEFKAAVEEDGEHAEAMFLIGQSHFDLRQMRDAVTHFKAALPKARKVPELEQHVIYKLGLAYEALGERVEATYYFRKISARGDLFPDVSHRLQRLA